MIEYSKQNSTRPTDQNIPMPETKAVRVNWTRPQTLAALHVYLQLPFGQLHQRNPKIKQLAAWIGRSSGSIALKLVNLASLDPLIVASGRVGMANASALDRKIWNELQANWDTVALEAAAEYEAQRFRYASTKPVFVKRCCQATTQPAASVDCGMKNWSLQATSSLGVRTPTTDSIHKTGFAYRHCTTEPTTKDSLPSCQTSKSMCR